MVFTLFTQVKVVALYFLSPYTIHIVFNPRAELPTPSNELHFKYVIKKSSRLSVDYGI